MFEDVMYVRHGSVSICSCANHRVLVFSGGRIVLDQFTSTSGPRGSPLLCAFTACPPSPSILYFWVLASAIQYQRLDHALNPASCGVCSDAMANGLLSKNRREQRQRVHPILPSIIGWRGRSSPIASAVIDVGKTFRDSVLSWIGCMNVTQLDSVLISHKHADAIGGLMTLTPWGTKGLNTWHTDASHAGDGFGHGATTASSINVSRHSMRVGQ